MADVDLVPLNEAYRDAIAAGRELTQNMKNWKGVIQNDGQLGEAAAADTLSQIAVGDAAAFRKATGTEFRDYGIGSERAKTVPDLSKINQVNQLFQFAGSDTINPPPGSAQYYGAILLTRILGSSITTTVTIPTSRELVGGIMNSDGSATWWRALTDVTTTKDSNGFIKAASPIFRLANVAQDAAGDSFTLDGCGAYNSEAEGVTASHDDLGVYTVSGSLGFSDEGWTIEIPQDVNGNRLCFVETETADDGTITVRTFGRRFDFDTAMVVAGDPIDIPDGRWIDLRLKMPETNPVKADHGDDEALV